MVRGGVGETTRGGSVGELNGGGGVEEGARDGSVRELGGGVALGEATDKPKRGRPRKQKEDGGVKRRPGRPRKPRPALEETTTDMDANKSTKRRRTSSSKVAVVNGAATSDSGAKRARGRPKKTVTASAPATKSTTMGGSMVESRDLVDRQSPPSIQNSGPRASRSDGIVAPATHRARSPLGRGTSTPYLVHDDPSPSESDEEAVDEIGMPSNRLPSALNDGPDLHTWTLRQRFTAVNDANTISDGSSGVYDRLVSDEDDQDEDGDPNDDENELHGDVFEGMPVDMDAKLAEGLEDTVNYDDALLGTARDRAVIKSWEASGWDKVPASTTPQIEYEGLYTGEWGPTRELYRLADNPLSLFFFFFPKKLFREMAIESNRYANDTVPERARNIRIRQLKELEQKKRQKEAVETRRQIRTRLRNSFVQFTPTEFDELVQHWHFSDNQNPRAATDRIWKIRPLVETLQDTFKRGYKPAAYLSFDEGMLPSHSRFNATRMYLKDKPHKWGTKLFLSCCSATAYCLRLEVYCGKKAHLLGPQTIDEKAGPSAVVRNLEHVLPHQKEGYHVVAVDRFYTSVSLAVELLARQVYIVGTVQPRGIGFPSFLKDKRKKRPSDISRGTYSAAWSRAVPSLVACCWWDSCAVYILATGSSLQERSIVRGSWNTDEDSNVPCPKVVVDYQRHMGGVDVFDQLRLQRYSVQLAFRFKKYYKSLALGLLDCALVNAYIVHKECFKRANKVPMSRADFLTTLQAQLLDVKSLDVDEPAQEREQESRLWTRVLWGAQATSNQNSSM